MLNFTRKEVENLLHFVEKEPAPQTSLDIKGIKESVLQLACLKYPHLITKVCTAMYEVLALVWQAQSVKICLANLLPSEVYFMHTTGSESISFSDPPYLHHCLVFGVLSLVSHVQ